MSERGGIRIGRGGATLLELCMVLAVAGLAASFAYPSFAALARGENIERAAVSLLMDLRLAQWRAVVSGRRVRIVPEAANGAWSYRIEREEGGGWVPDGEDRRLPRGAALQAAGGAVKLFNPDGTSSAGSLSLAAPGGGLYRYTLTPATGRVRFYRGDREAARGA